MKREWKKVGKYARMHTFFYYLHQAHRSSVQQNVF